MYTKYYLAGMLFPRKGAVQTGEAQVPFLYDLKHNILLNQIAKNGSRYEDDTGVYYCLDGKVPYVRNAILPRPQDRDKLFWADGTKIYPNMEPEMKDELNPAEAPASNKNIIPFEPLAKRLARGGNFFGGGGNNEGGDTDKPNWLRLIEPGTKIVCRTYKLKNSFVLDVFLIYSQDGDVTVIEPLIPGTDAGLWHVDNQLFSNQYKLYNTYKYNQQEETSTDDESNRTD